MLGKLNRDTVRTSAGASWRASVGSLSVWESPGGSEKHRPQVKADSPWGSTGSLDCMQKVARNG